MGVGVNVVWLQVLDNKRSHTVSIKGPDERTVAANTRGTPDITVPWAPKYLTFSDVNGAGKEKVLGYLYQGPNNEVFWNEGKKEKPTEGGKKIFDFPNPSSNWGATGTLSKDGKLGMVNS